MLYLVWGRMLATQGLLYSEDENKDAVMDVCAY